MRGQGRPTGRSRGGQGGYELRARIEARERRVLERSIQGASQREIATAEGITQGAVSKILRRMESRVLEELVAVVEQQKARQTLRLDYLYREGLHAWEASKADATRRVQRKSQSVTGAATATVVQLAVDTQHGDPRYLEVARKALADQRTLWGLDAPQKLDVRASHHPFSAMTDEVLTAELARQQRLLAAIDEHATTRRRMLMTSFDFRHLAALQAEQLKRAAERSLRAQWGEVAGMDFFTTEVWTPLGLTTYYVLFLIDLKTRRAHVAGITTTPDGVFMAQIARNLTDPVDGFLRGHRFVICDRHAKFSTQFRSILRVAGVDAIRAPRQAPNCNAYAERFVLSIKSECLDRMMFFGEASLRRAVGEYLQHYHRERPHQGIGNETLRIAPRETTGEVRCTERLDGLLKHYERAA